MTALDLVTSSLRLLGVIGGADTPSGEDADLGLSGLNLVLDSINADRAAACADVVRTFTILPSVQPHTIGPSGANLTIAQRPVSIEWARVVDGTGVRSPITIRDSEWWMGLRVPAVTSTAPSDLYYEPDWPNGKLYLWPVSSGSQVEFLSRIQVSQVALTTVVSFPPGDLEAITLTLAEHLAPPFLVVLAPSLVEKASKARARVYANNDRTPRISTWDAGMPGGRGGGGSYRTGWM